MLTNMDFSLLSAIRTSLDVGHNPKLLWSYILAIIVTYWVYSLLSFRQSSSFPIINHDKNAWTYYAAKEKYVKNARQLLAEGLRKFSGPFHIITESGPVLILPPETMDSINAEKNLSFHDYVRVQFLAEFDSFRTMRPWPHGMFGEAVLKGITRPLPRFTKSMSLELATCLEESWGNQKEWREVRFIDDAQGWVARMSNMTFLGEKFARNKEWVRITTSFTMTMFMAVRATKKFHPLLRPLVNYFSPLNRKVRRDQAVIASILEPVLKERHEEIAAARKEGRTPNLPDDSIEWFRNSAAGRPYAEIWIQLSLAQVAIQTTSNQLCQTILYLCAYPEYVEPLRKEAIEVLSKHGLGKQVLNELYFLDSFLKETQRLRPDGMTNMQRRAIEDVELPGGIKIKKGEMMAVSALPMWDERNYPNPERFDPYRFIQRRKLAGYETKSAFVSTSSDHLGFGYGKTACPGRFLAASILKIATLHLLFKYDMKIADPADANPSSYGQDVLVNTQARVWMRARKPEIDLEALAQSI